jgi:hypothetical protein
MRLRIQPLALIHGVPGYYGQVPETTLLSVLMEGFGLGGFERREALGWRGL